MTLIKGFVVTLTFFCSWLQNFFFPMKFNLILFFPGFPNHWRICMDLNGKTKYRLQNPVLHPLKLLSIARWLTPPLLRLQVKTQTNPTHQSQKLIAQQSQPSLLPHMIPLGQQVQPNPPLQRMPLEALLPLLTPPLWRVIPRVSLVLTQLWGFHRVKIREIL